jgi:predicted transcriptional regulator
MVTTIQVDENLKDRLDSLKIHHRETYNELILRLINNTSPNNLDRESLIETIEVLSDPDTMRDIAQALDDFHKGRFVELK